MQPRNPLWDKIRRYLILWAVILILLSLIALFQYWDQIVAALGTGVEQTLSGIISLVIVVAIFDRSTYLREGDVQWKHWQRPYRD